MYHLEKNDSTTKIDFVLKEILNRLDRIERRLKALERDKTPSAKKPKETKFDKFSDTVSIVGLKEFSTARQCSIKCIWIIIFVICITSTSYFVYKTYFEYRKEPTATKVKLVEQVQYDYPVMLLCPDSWLDADKVIGDGLSIGGLQYALGFLINYYVRPPPYKIDDYHQAKIDFEEYYSTKGFNDLVHFFNWIALDSEVFFYQCPFCLNNTFRKILMNDAVCYQIPMHSTPGNAPVVNSLDHLDVLVPDRSRNFLAPKLFWRLYLGLDMHLGEATRRYAEIYPHQSNTIQFITHKFVSVDKPDNPCVMESDNYSWARCVLQCFLPAEGHYLMTACNSIDNCDNSMLTPNQTYNWYEEHLWEKLVAMHTESQQMGTEAPKHCYDACPSPCQRTIYTIDVQSHTRVPSLDWPTPIKDNNSLGQERKSVFSTPDNLTRLSFLNTAAVYGGVLTFEEVSTYSFETLIGNVGGMLSLWMGISIMSIIQIAMFAMTECLPRKGEKQLNHMQNLDAASGASLLERSTVV